MSEELQLTDILKTLSPLQLKFVEARMVYDSDREAARAIGTAPETVYKWAAKERINQAIVLARIDSVNVAREKLRRLAGKAVDALEELLSCTDNKEKRQAAAEILDRIGLPAQKAIDVTSGGGALPSAQVVIYLPSNGRDEVENDG